MSNLVDFFIRYKNTLLFLFLLFISLFLTLQTHSYQKSKFISSTNFVSSQLYSWRNDIDTYFYLKQNNQRLIDENRDLRQRLLNIPRRVMDSVYSDTTQYAADYTVHKANVIANHYAKLDNYILIDGGKNDSITEELGVITSRGIVGVVEKSSKNFSRVISILNSNLKINAQMKNSEHFGTLKWNGGDPNTMTLTDVPRTATVAKGDTVITNGRSLIFPKGIPIGRVQDFIVEKGKNYYDIDIKLFNDMTNIGNVYVIINNSRPEIDSLIEADEH